MHINIGNSVIYWHIIQFLTLNSNNGSCKDIDCEISPLVVISKPELRFPSFKFSVVEYKESIFPHFLDLPLSIYLWGVQCGLLIHGLYPVDESLEDVGHMLQ